MHSPALEEEKRLARSKGGLGNRHIQEPLPAVQVDTISDVKTLLGMAINEVREGILDIRVANCIGYLAGHLTKAFELDDLEQRVAAMEKKLLTKSYVH